MRKYQENGMLESVVCNGCGKKLVVERGILREGGFAVNYPWDYFSEKDGEIHHWDLCEDCYDSLIHQFVIAPDLNRSTFGGIFYRIGNQVEDNLMQPPLVPHHCRCVPAHFTGELFLF